MLTFDILIAFLPYLCLLGLILICLFRRHDLLDALIYAALAWSCIIWLETNILGWLGLVRGEIIACFWVSCAVVISILAWKWRRPLQLACPAGWDWAWICIGVFTLIAAIAYPPNNYDVLTYHMPRVEHWLQNHSLAPYTTSIDRQIGMAPFNAMIVLQTYGPARLDFFVNLYQWLAFMGSIVAVRGLTGLIGGSSMAQASAIIFAVTLPTAIIQASNTDSCLLVAFYLCSLAVLWLQWRKEPRFSLMLAIGLCLGFAILSKGSAYPIAFPFVCLIAWQCIRKPRKLIIHGAIAALIVAGLNIPHFVRSVQGEGNMIASAERNVLRHPTPATFLINTVYNFVSNQPILLSHGGRGYLKLFTRRLGIEQDDKDIFPWGGLDFAKTYYAPSDTSSANPFQSAFLLLLLGAVIFAKFRPPALYSWTVLASFAMYSLILTWHPWVSRIHVPLFFLAGPIAGIFLASFRRIWLRNFFLGLACFCAIWPTFLCVERPLAPPSFVDLYRHNVRHFLNSPRVILLFNNAPDQAGPYIGAMDYIARQKTDRIGLRLGNNGWEYPVWALLGKMRHDLPFIEHIIDDMQPNQPEYMFEYIRNDTDSQSNAAVSRLISGKRHRVYPEDASGADIGASE